MTDAPRPPVPGERRLDHPPSDRYRDLAHAEESGGGTADSRGSVGRAVAGGFLAGLAGAIATIVLGGVLSVSAGLVVVAAATGWAVGMATRVGMGEAIDRSRRSWLALMLAIVAVVLGQLGLWLYARTEGGVLTLPDYLAQTFGLLVPVQAAIAAGVAWWSAR